MNVSEYSMRQLPAALINAPCILDDWKNMAQTPLDASALLKTGVLNNANNNASSGPWRGLRSPSLSAAASHSKLSYLERVLLEIVESERMYVQDLRSIIENYLGKIIDTQELLLRPEQVSALFGNIEDIYELNSELLQELDSCHNDPVAVAQCFVHRSQDFNIYTQYCNNYPNSVAALTECMRNKQLAKFFRERQEQIRHSLPLGSYLLKPVQRILKYHLLLQEIAKHFDREGDGYEVVEEAIATMTCVAWYINDMKRKHEHAVRLQEIQSLLINWKGPDLTTYGELVLEGTFRVHRVRNERTFFLLDKILLITKKRGDHYICKSHIPCSSLMLIESTRDSLCFTVTHYKHNKQQYNIQAKSGDEKRVWTHHLKRLILENHHAIIPQKVSGYRFPFSLMVLDIRIFLKHFGHVRSPIELDKVLDISSHREECLEESPQHPDLDHHGLLDQGSDNMESAANVEELKPLSSEEEEEGEDGHAPQSSSILPFSVLDQASIIAERFASSLSRRNSLVHEEGKGYLTPKMASRSSSILSLEGGEKAECCSNGCTTVDSQSCSILQEPSAEPYNGACNGAVRPGLVESDHSSCRRKESMLSHQDRLLLDKIKNYYDYAEHQDANFSVKRRESLSFIPKGLVRNSVFRINSLPQPEPGQEVLKRKRPALLDNSVAGKAASLMLSNRPGVVLPLPHLETTSEENPVPITEAEFRPPCEMIKLWEEMEQPKRTEDCREHKANGGLGQTESYLKARLGNQENGFDFHEPLLILEDEDLGDIVEEEPVVPPPENKAPVEQTMPSRLPWKAAQELGSCDQDQSFPQVPPHIMQLAHLTEAELTEKVRNKVYQLARQYSLRIKNQKPPMQSAYCPQPSGSSFYPPQKDGRLSQKKSPLCLPNYEQIVLQEASSRGLLSSSSTCQKSPKRFSSSNSSVSLSSPTSSYTLSHSPLSPIMTEKFDWPDVRELRSRYSCQVAIEKCRPPLVNRSCSAPEKMVDDAKMQAESQGSKVIAKTDVKSQQWDKQSCRRKSSLDSIPKGLVCDRPKEFCVTAKASLENNQHVIVIEKLPEGTNEAKADEREPQILSSSDQEKLSPKELVEWYKSYQDSEERQRHEGDVQEAWWEKTSSQNNLVKNLREKFQTLNSTS
uniref:Pleckstrin homology and RhoGEF domain containing G3 n=1 Tax=Pseudonaja textilis TaxID=8673 RepID=A0A670YW45_PSETE